MAKSIKSGFCSLHLFLQYMQVLCSWNLCNQPNYRTSFKSLKLGFAMGSLAEKLIHFVTKRSIHEFFLNYLPVWILLQFAKLGPDHVPTTFKNQLPKSEMQVLLTLLFYHFSPPILSFFMLFHSVSAYWLLYKHMIRPKVPGKSLVSRHRHHFKLIMSKGSFLHPLRD